MKRASWTKVLIRPPMQAPPHPVRREAKAIKVAKGAAVAGMFEVAATKVVVVKAKPGVEETQAARPEVLSKTPLRQRRAKRKGPVGLSMEKVEEAEVT